MTLHDAIQTLTQNATARTASVARLADAVEELTEEMLTHTTAGDAVTVAGRTYRIDRYQSHVGSSTFLWIEGRDEEEGGIIGSHMGAYLHGDFHCPLSYAGLQATRHFATHAREIVVAFATLASRETAANMSAAEARDPVAS